MPWKLNQDSLSKCLVYFVDGNTRTFYSLDWSNRYSQFKNRELGLDRLRKLILGWGGKVKTAIIYDLASQQEIERYHDGIKINNL